MVTVTTRFMSRKLFMFFEVFIPSFVYDVIDMFCLPNKKVRDTYNQKKIEMFCISSAYGYR